MQNYNMQRMGMSTGRIEAWYTSLYPVLLRLGAGFRLPEEEIKDLIHQFFLELLEKESRLQTIDNPRAYLVAAFNRKLIDRVQSAKRQRFSVLTEASTAGSLPSIQDILIQSQTSTEQISRIKKAFLALPPRCRRVIILKYYKGLSTDEIAIYTGLSKRSVYNNLFEGIRLLREVLNMPR